ncbi:protein O-mannosyl-transferase family, partial [bacterium]
IGHPYGHPLFWLLGRLSIMILPGSPAAAMNHLVTAFSAATVGIGALLIRDRLAENLSPPRRLIIIMTIAGLFATATTVWTQATFTEVYNLQAFFLALTLYCLHRFSINQDSKYFCASLYFLGISITLGIYAGILLILPFGIGFFSENRKTLSFAILTTAVLLFFLGLSIWTYLPVRSAANPVFHWEPINSFSALIHYLGRTHAVHTTPAGLSAIPMIFWKILQGIYQNLNILGVILIVCFFLRKGTQEKKREAFFYLYAMSFVFIAYTVTIPLLMNFRQLVEMDVYYIPVLLLSIPVLTDGADTLSRILKKPLGFLISVPVILGIGFGWTDISLSNHQLTENYNQYLKDSIPENFEILPASNTTEHCLYYQMYALKNSKSYRLRNVNLLDGEKMQLRQHLNRRGILFETNWNLLSAIENPDDYRIAGPFFTHSEDSLLAHRLEKEFINKFTFLESDRSRLHTLDRIHFASLWSRRGKYWWWYFLNRESAKRFTDHTIFQKALHALRIAAYLDDFSLAGATRSSDLALFLMNAGYLDEAETFALQAIRINACSREGRRALYNLHLHRGDDIGAYNQLKKWRRLDPNNGDILMDMASLLITRKQYDRAKEAYRKGLSLGANPRPSLESRLYQAE